MRCAIVDSFSSVDGKSVIFSAELSTGTYYLKITYAGDIDENDPYVISYNSNQFETEPNEKPAQSTNFDINKKIQGNISSITDRDFFTFNLSSPRYIALTILCPEGIGDFSLDLFKESETNLIDSIDIVNGKEVTVHMGLSAGQYYLMISPSASAQTPFPYILSFADSDQKNLEIESNNTMKFANSIDKGVPKKGRIYSVKDIDFYGFHLGEQPEFNIQFKPSATTADYKINVTDTNGNVIASRTSKDGQAMSIPVSADPGDYFIKIANGGDTDPVVYYELTITGDAVISMKKPVAVVINGSDNQMDIGGFQSLTASVQYSDVTSEVIPNPVWKSLNENAASVSSVGKVTAIAEGSTSIIAASGDLTGRFDITIGSPAVTYTQHYGSLIIAAGGGSDSTDTLFASTQYLSDLVYRRFLKRLVTEKDIYYFNPIAAGHDIDGDGYDNNIVNDSTPTVAEFGKAITEWASKQSTDGPLYIYLIDHGGINTFKLGNSEILTAQQLNGFIDTFQTATNRQVIVMIEACKSGSFTDDIAIQGKERLIVTCTNDDDAYQQLGGKVSFTQFFIDRLLTGKTIYESYTNAKDRLSGMGLPYSKMKPQLAEGVSLGSKTVVGRNFVIAGFFPEITETSASSPIDANTTQTFYAKLTNLDTIESVWAVLIPPDYAPPSTAQDLQAPQVSLPTFDLSGPDKDGKYEGTYNKFTYNGTYRITFYAKDKNGLVAVSPPITMTVTRGLDILTGDLDNDKAVTLADAILGLKIIAGLNVQNVNIGADVGTNGKIGLEKVIYILRKSSRL